MTEYYEKLVIDKAEADKIKKFLAEPKSEEECLGEDFTYIHSVTFKNGLEADIKICGVQYEEGGYNAPYTEAVLFKNGCEVSCTDVECVFFGRWILKYDGDLYLVDVDEEVPKKEHKYEVEYLITRHYAVTVYADSEEEAKEICDSLYDNDEIISNFPVIDEENSGVAGIEEIS